MDTVCWAGVHCTCSVPLDLLGHDVCATDQSMDQSYGSCAKDQSKGNVLKDQSYGDTMKNLMHVQRINPMGQCM